MTIQAFVFLRTLKRVQRSEGLSVKVDPFWGFVSTYGCERNFVIDKDLRKKGDAVKNLTDYLEKEGLLSTSTDPDEDGSYIVHLTHGGYHYIQIILSNLAQFLVRSIAVPIFVSIVTAAITVLLTK